MLDFTGNQFDLRELYNSLGEQEFIGKMTNLIKTNKVSLVKSPNLTLRNMEEAIHYKAFSFLTGVQTEHLMMAAYKDVPAPLEPIFEKISVSSETVKHVDIAPAMMPKPIVGTNWADELMLTDTSGNITNYAYGRMVSISEDVVIYDQKSEIVSRATQLGKGMRYFEEMMRTKVLIDASSNAYLGSALWTLSTNYLEGAGTAFGITSLGNAEALMLNQYAPSQESDNIPAMAFPRYLIYPQAIKNTVYSVLNSTNLPQTAEAGANPVKDMNLQPVLSLWLRPLDSTAGTTAWYLAAERGENGLIEQEVLPVRTVTIAGTDELKMKNLYLEMNVKVIKGWGANNYRGVVKMKGAA